MISVKNFSYSYPNNRPALKNINLSVSSGEFVLIAGPNGGGKSTLLQAILGVVPEYYGGEISGRITFEGKDVKEFGIVKLAGKIGIVLQDPESQISNLTVWEEVTFALGNLLTPQEEIIQRGKQSLETMDILPLRNASVETLSGGQLQRLAIATLVALHPRIMILDEPLASLDPLGVKSVIDALKVLKNFVDVIIVASHWLDPFLDLSTRLIVVDSGSIVLDIPSATIDNHQEELSFHSVEIPQRILIKKILSSQGIKYFSKNGSLILPNGKTLKPVQHNASSNADFGLVMDGVSYSYSGCLETLKNVTLSLRKHSRTAIAGRNGAGKSTLARLLAGLRKPKSGRLIINYQTISMTTQKPSLGFITNKVLEELRYGLNLSEAEAIRILEEFNLAQFKEVSPFTLSGGEQRRFSLALALSSKPDQIILDEPTAGMDTNQVRFMISTMEKFDGASVFVTHDPRLVGTFLKEIAVIENGMLFFKGVTSDLDSETFSLLGYQFTNATVKFALQYLQRELPMLPSQIEVIHESSI